MTNLMGVKARFHFICTYVPMAGLNPTPEGDLGFSAAPPLASLPPTSPPLSQESVIPVPRRV